MIPVPVKCQQLHLCRTQTHLNTTVRNLSTTVNYNALVKQGAVLPDEKDNGGLVNRALGIVGIAGPMKYNRFKMRTSAQKMYESCVDEIDSQKFFDVCNLPDTLFSWFIVTQLHVWLSMVRLRREGREGKYMVHYLVYCMWHDVEARGKAMGISTIKVKEGLKEMIGQFYAALFAYDEAVLSNDTNALHDALQNIFFNRECNDPRQLAVMADYVTQQVQYLETLDSESLIERGRIQWLPLNTDLMNIKLQNR